MSRVKAARATSRRARTRRRCTPELRRTDQKRINHGRALVYDSPVRTRTDKRGRVTTVYRGAKAGPPARGARSTQTLETTGFVASMMKRFGMAGRNV